MFETMTVTKAVGAVCASLLVLLLGGWAAESLYSTHPAQHAGEEAQQAYAIDTGAATDEAAPVEEGPPFEELLASADVTAGEKVFGKCASCHKVNGEDGVGPHLNGVVNRPKAAVEGFGYSEANLALADQSWTPENLNGFLENPKNYMPGTKMSFAGLPKPQDRANVIAWLATTQ
jgi:cytochrome c